MSVKPRRGPFLSSSPIVFMLVTWVATRPHADPRLWGIVTMPFTHSNGSHANKMTKEQFASFYDLETSLHKKETRNSRERVSALIADDFLEFGKSGGILTKRDTLDGLEDEAVDLQVEVSDFAARQLSPDVVLVTYTAAMLDGGNPTMVATNRSSVWVLRDGRWQMAFHQGTKRSASGPRSPQVTLPGTNVDL